VTDGSAVAYLCDGRQLESWLQGTVAGGRLALTGSGGANLTGALGPAGAAGTVTAAGRTWTFEAPPATRPSGLYRIAATVNGAKVVGGWIVLADGSQVGVVSIDGTPAAAPPLDTSTGAVTVNGTQVTALPVDGTNL
jgi:serine/threonine-protein kinase